MKPTLARTAVSGGALALTLGVAAPALACVDSSATGVKPATFTAASHHTKHGDQHSDRTLTLAELKATSTGWLDVKIDRLGKVRDRIETSTRLSDTEKSDALAWIDAKVARLQAGRDAVAAATTKVEVKAALKTAFTATVDEVRARVDLMIDRWMVALTARIQAVQSDTSVSTERQATKLASLQAWLDKLAALKADVASASTAAEVRAAVTAADLDLMVRGHDRFGWGWFGMHAKGKHHDRADHRSHRHDQADPGRWDRHHGSTRTVNVSWHHDSGDRSWGRDDHRGGHHDRGHHGFGHR